MKRIQYKCNLWKQCKKPYHLHKVFLHIMALLILKENNHLLLLIACWQMLKAGYFLVQRSDVLLCMAKTVVKTLFSQLSWIQKKVLNWLFPKEIPVKFPLTTNTSSENSLKQLPENKEHAYFETEHNILAWKILQWVVFLRVSGLK